MSESAVLAATVRRTGWLGPPGGSVCWLFAMMICGVVLPIFATVLYFASSFYPIGDQNIFGSLGPVVALVLGVCVPLAILVIGPIYSLLAWSWRPVMLAAFHGFLLIPGFVLSIMISGPMYTTAMKQFRARSLALTDAIFAYERANGEPPATLDTLVPAYLAAIPSTGMNAASAYRYTPTGEFCPSSSRWHLMVRLPGDLLSSAGPHVFCPTSDGAGGWHDIRFGSD